MIKKNLGNSDRFIRVVASLTLAYAAYRASGPLAVSLGVFAAVMLLTAIVGWCGLYTLLGINTCPLDKPK